MSSTESATTKQCPACGGMNYPRADRCAVCGANLNVPAVKEPEPPPIAPQAQEAAPPSPPPPSPYFAPEEKKKEAPPPFGRTLFKSLLNDYLIPLAAGGGLIMLLIALGEKKPEPERTAARQPRYMSAEVQDIFMTYVLRNGADKGKTMRQFWGEYVSVFKAARPKGGAPVPVEVVFLQQAVTYDQYNIFVVEKVAGDKHHIFPFQVNLEAKSVMPALDCEFAIGTKPEYAGAVCESPAAIFPEGL